MNVYRKPATVKDLRVGGRIVLAEGEVTGHHHHIDERPVVTVDDPEDLLPAADFFEEPSGRRVLLITRRCVLRHQEHGAIELDPCEPVQVRQGDVLLNPIGAGAWEVVRQREYEPQGIRQVAD